jgi:hypothetical protein
MSETSIRTQVRDAIVAALESLKSSDSARLKKPEISLYYDAIEDVKTFPTYCVVCTNETITSQTQGAADVELEVLVIVYVKDDKDARHRRCLGRAPARSAGEGCYAAARDRLDRDRRRHTGRQALRAGHHAVEGQGDPPDGHLVTH